MSGTTNVPSVYVIIRDDNKALFILRANTGWKDNEYVVPSGHVEDNETFRQAACREAMEEVGVQIDPEDLEYKTTIHRKGPSDVRVDVWFEAIKWSGTPKNMEPEKHSEVAWLELDALPDNIVDYIDHGVRHIESGLSYGEFGWATA